MSIDKNRIISICHEATTNRYPDINIDSLELEGISYDTLNSGPPLLVKFSVVEDNNQSSGNNISYELWVRMNADGSEARPLSMNDKFRVPSSHNLNENKSMPAVITFNTNTLLSVSYEAIILQHPDIKTNWLEFQRLSYDSERSKSPLHVIFHITESSYDNPGSELLWVEMNENGSKPEVKILRRPIGRIKR